MNPLDALAPRLTGSPEPFTAPLSRLLVIREPDHMMSVRAAVYETPMSQTALVTDLVLRDDRGERLQVRRVRPDRIELRSTLGSAELCFADPATLAFETRGVAAAEWVTPVSSVPQGWKSLDARAWGGTLSRSVTPWGPKWELRTRSAGKDMTFLIGVGDLPSRDHFGDRAERSWQAWFAAATPPQAGDYETYLHAWWAMAVNQLRLNADQDLTAVVPSKAGYVGLWQWDAYFAVIGLRHGQGELAQQQLELALRYQLGDGQLPDVVHDEGTLYNVDGLPGADRARLAEHVGSRDGSGTGSALRPSVPVTKPPLAAWALAKLATRHKLGAFGDFAMPRVRKAHEWWFRASDPDGEGLPRYLHPYSSGVDDCPVWDFGTDVLTPDLGSYLTLNGDALADLAGAGGNSADAEMWRREAGHVSARMVARLWDPAQARFASRQGGAWLPSRTALDLMPLLTGRLAPAQLDSIVRSLDQPATFGALYRVPTAGLSDPAFDPEGMWRGPVWLNTNYLLIQGLRRSGRHDAADRLADGTLSMVRGSPSIAEYWNPLTGQPAQRAVAPFTWSAALYIDLAVTGGSLT